MYLRFTPTISCKNHPVSKVLKKACKGCRTLEQLLVFWVAEERHFTISKRINDRTGHSAVFIEFFENELMVGVAKVRFGSFLRSSYRLSPLARQVMQLSEEILECHAGENWFRRHERP